MFIYPSPNRMDRQDRARMLLDAIRTLRNQRSLNPEQRRRGIDALTQAYLREVDGPAANTRVSPTRRVNPTWSK